jgi:hypothetical protein
MLAKLLSKKLLFSVARTPKSLFMASQVQARCFSSINAASLEVFLKKAQETDDPVDCSSLVQACDVAGSNAG